MQSQDHRRYRVIEAIGKGGFGTVYKAELLGVGGFSKTVALKVLNPNVEGMAEVAGRLRDEARMLGLVRHRAIVQVDGLLQLAGRWTVVMEYIDGVDLKRILSGGPIPVGPALEIIQEVANALYVAYERPPARELERRARAVRMQLPEPWLSDWAEAVVPPLAAQREPIPDELTGSVLIEDTFSAAAVAGHRWPNDDSTAADFSYAGENRGATRWLVLGVAVVSALFVTAVGGAVLAWVWAHQHTDPTPRPPVNATEAAATEAAATEAAATEAAATEAAATEAAATEAAATEAAATEAAATEAAATEAAATAAAEAAKEDTPPAPARTSRASTGQVLVTGDPADVTLVSGSKRLKPGRVPAGTYQVSASFGGAPAVNSGEVTVSSGGTVTLTCKAVFKRCAAL